MVRFCGVCGVGMYVYIIGVCKSILVYYVCMWLCIEGRSVCMVLRWCVSSLYMVGCSIKVYVL